MISCFIKFIKYFLAMIMMPENNLLEFFQKINYFKANISTLINFFKYLKYFLF